MMFSTTWHRRANHIFLVIYCGCFYPSAVFAADPPVDVAIHRQIAKKTNTRVWKLLSKNVLTKQEQYEIIYTAYASLYHWTIAGNTANKQRAEWLLARVHAELGQGERALAHAMKCLELTRRGEPQIRDFDLAYAYEGASRANAALGIKRAARRYYKLALDAAKKIADKKDRALFESDLAAGNWHGFKY